MWESIAQTSPLATFHFLLNKWYNILCLWLVKVQYRWRMLSLCSQSTFSLPMPTPTIRTRRRRRSDVTHRYLGALLSRQAFELSDFAIHRPMTLFITEPTCLASWRGLRVPFRARDRIVLPSTNPATSKGNRGPWFRSELPLDRSRFSDRLVDLGIIDGFFTICWPAG